MYYIQSSVYSNVVSDLDYWKDLAHFFGPLSVLRFYHIPHLGYTILKQETWTT